MAITATFKADFSSFTQAVDKAEVQLRSFETGAGKVEKALGRMTDTFSGRRVIQEATLTARAIEDIGGVSRLTENELARVGAQAQEAVAKLKAMGMEVPEGIQKVADATKNASGAFGGFGNALGSINGLLGAFGVGLSVSALVGFGKALLNDADALVKMSDRTGISIQALQRLQVAGDDAGNTIEEMSSAINQMQNRLAGGDASATGALQKLGMSFADIKSLSPDKQFIAISDALRGVEDPAQQVAIAMDLFGKSGASVLPTLKRGFDDVRDAAVGMSEETAQALDKMGDDFQAFYRTSKGVAAGVVVELYRIVQDGLNPLTYGFNSAKREVESWKQALTGAMGAAETGAPNLMAAFGVDMSKQFELSESALRAFDREMAESQAIKEKDAAAAKRVADEYAKFVGVVNDVVQSARDWRDVLLEIDGSVVQAIGYYREQGVALEKIATMYGLTSAQSSAVATALKVEAESIASTSRLWAEYASIRSAQGSTATERQIADVQRWAAETAAAAQRAGTDTMAFYEALAADTTAKLSAISVDWAKINSELSTGTQAGLQEIADKAQATYQAALAHVGEFSDGAIQRFRDTADAAQLAANAFGTGFESASVRATAALQETVNQAAKAKAALDMMFAGDAVPTSESLSAAAMRPGSFLGFGGGTMQQGTTGFVSNMPWPARANGGPVSSGQPYMVGERGPEIFTPSQSGFITPNGGGNSITVNISAGVFDRSTVAGLADQIGQELMRRVNRRLPSA